ncbi:hypothetical protein [Peteryoungia algae]|uniref:Uncharacterized protein n=1 Tax=Peteryoungia algae TaxID=2919917 RepID=A0ABT0CZA4_9HYPH|nr:hypothetical protein [Rhizobium sp. SSM4.3]MCJ8238492.1 hypothetical protein [Rhizobium sp. SSM4.3]
MVERISRTSSSEASSQTEAGSTLNLDSDPMSAWVASRQSKINHDIEERHRQAEEERARNGAPSDNGETRHALSPRQWPDPSETPDPLADGNDEPRLSGESERIGTQNFDEDTPFGNRVVIV